jgi:CBS domain-containing protein
MAQLPRPGEDPGTGGPAGGEVTADGTGGGPAGGEGDVGEGDVGAYRVADLMSTVLYAVARDETVLVAWETLERSGFHHLPVVETDGHCIGLLDRAEVAVACAAPAASLSGHRVDGLLQGRRPAVVHEEDTARRAATVMNYTGADALPVVGDQGILVGLLTARDIVAAFAGQPVPGRPGGRRPPVPFPAFPGLPPRRHGPGTGGSTGIP